MSLVGIQIALGTVLLILTGLLLNSFIKVMNAARGYDVERLLALELAPYGDQYASPAQRINFYRGLLNQIRSITGVEAAGAISALPIAESAGSNRIDYATDSRQDEQSGALLGRPVAGVRVATPGYFATAGIVLRAGRFFTETDRAPVAVVGDGLAKSLWPGEPPDAVIGRQIRQGDVQGPLITIIGVVSDARSGSLERELLPQLYRPHHQRAFGMMTVVIRTAQQPEAISSPLRAEIRKMDGNIPIPVLRTLREILDASVAQRRFQLGLISLFGLASLMLGIVGIYGAVAYSVSCRTRDIGLRIALGAVQRDVMQWILLNGMKPVLIGLSAGLFCAVAIGRAIQGVLFEVAPSDLSVLSSVATLLLVTSALACYVPARRAARLDPVVALRIQ
jgi:putative ABC transport system permease protein